MYDPIFNKLVCNGMSDWGDDIIKGTEIGEEMGDIHTRNFLNNIK